MKSVIHAAALGWISLVMSLGPSPGAQQVEPATAAEAATVLDLSTFPQLDPVDGANALVIASQSYVAKNAVMESARKVKKQLMEGGWKELEGASYTDDYASAIFQKSGFTVSLSVMPGGETGTSSVNITNHGNVNLKTLPRPAGAVETYAFPASCMWVAPAGVTETSAECLRLLAADGWEPFGETTVSFFVKKNAVRLQFMISESPVQQGQTAIQVTSEQMSLDLPAPPEAEGLQYSDPSGQLFFDSQKPPAEWVTWFGDRLGKSGWQATTENPVKIDFHEELVFRSPVGELITLEFNAVDGKTRVLLKHQSARKVAEMLQKAEALGASKEAERQAEMERKMNPAVIIVPVPAGTTIVEESAKRIEFSTQSGSARAALAEWLKKQENAGWKLKTIVDSKEAGEFELGREGVQLNAGFVDPGFLPGSITLTVWGEYQLKLEQK